MSKKAANHIKTFFQNPANVILVVFFVLLAALTLYPLLSLVLETYSVHPMEMQLICKPIGALTPYHWKRLLTGGEYSVNNFYRPSLV